MSIEVPLGTGTIAVDLDAYEYEVAEPPGMPARDPAEVVAEAIESPTGAGLEDVVDAGDEVAIVVTDITRKTPDAVLLRELFERLPPVEPTIVIGLGLHRPMSEAEIRDALGEFAEFARNHDPAETVTVGEVDGVPIEVHESIARADAVISTGLVEPHQYAGFSGGAKTVAIGAGGEPFIGYTHGPELLSQPGVRLGRIEDNPFREAVDRAGDRIGLEFCLNVARGPAGVVDAAAGDPRAVVAELAETLREAYSVEIEGEFDAVVSGLGAPKDANLYQATRAATYVVLGPRNPLRPGGTVIVPARLDEGAGQGTGEQRFYEWLANAPDAGTLVEEMRAGYEPGAQRAFIVAQCLTEYSIAITDSQAPDVVEDCLMTAEPHVTDALESGDSVLVVPDALNTLLY